MKHTFGFTPRQQHYFLRVWGTAAVWIGLSWIVGVEYDITKAMLILIFHAIYQKEFV